MGYARLLGAKAPVRPRSAIARAAPKKLSIFHERSFLYYLVFCTIFRIADLNSVANAIINLKSPTDFIQLGLINVMACFPTVVQPSQIEVCGVLPRVK